MLSPDMTTVGEVELNALPKPKKLIVQWKIREFLSLSEKVNYSRLFPFANECWCLCIQQTEGGIYSADYINLFLIIKSSGPSGNIDFSLSLKTSDDKKVLEKHKTFDFKMEKCSGFVPFLSRLKLLERESELMPSNILTIICTLKCPKSTEDTNTFSAKNNNDGTIEVIELSSDEEDIPQKTFSSKVKGLEILSENLKQVFLDGRMSDAVLKVDGQEFNVHKVILSARSPVFASMFQHNLAEKNTNEVNIPDCTAESFEVFLRYLYSGSVETLSTSNVYNAYYAADKYQIDDLKEKCVNFMMENISVGTFCDVIALSLRHGESKLQKTATVFFSQNVKKIIKTVEWIKYMETNAVQANELLIKALNA